MAFKLTVTGFSEGANIPKRFTCDGEDLSPALQWAGEPAKTQSFALIMDDPDAPGGAWNHSLVWDIPSHIHSLPEGDGHASLGNLEQTTSADTDMEGHALLGAGVRTATFSGSSRSMSPHLACLKE